MVRLAPRTHLIVVLAAIKLRSQAGIPARLEKYESELFLADQNSSGQISII